MINGFENILVFFFFLFLIIIIIVVFQFYRGRCVMLQIGVDILLGWKLLRNASCRAEKKRSLEERKRLFSPRRSKHHHRHWLVSINMYSAFMVMNGMLLFNLINVSIINLMTLRVHMDQIRMFFVSLHWFALTLWCLIVVRPCSLHWILEF